MQTLKLADDLFAGLKAGYKKATVRLGKRDVELGALVFEAVNGGYPDAEVEVTRVTYTLFAHLNNDDARKDGASSADELRTVLKRFYPDANPSSIVTIVEFV